VERQIAFEQSLFLHLPLTCPAAQMLFFFAISKKYPQGELNSLGENLKSLLIKSLRKTKILSCPPAWTI